MVSEFKRGDQVLDFNGGKCFYSYPLLNFDGDVNGHFVNPVFMGASVDDRWTSSVTKPETKEDNVEFKRGDKVLDSDGHPSFYCNTALNIDGHTSGHYVNSNSKLNPNQDRWTKSVTKENKVEFKHGEKVLGGSHKGAYYYVGNNPKDKREYILVDKNGELFQTETVTTAPRVLKKGDPIYVRDDESDSWSDVNGNSSVIFHGMYEGMVVCLDHKEQHLRDSKLWIFAIHVDDV